MSSSDTEVRDGLLVVRRGPEGARIRLSLQGELDLANVKTAEDALQGALDSGCELLIDLTRLEFIDSTGLSLLVMALRRAEGRLSFVPSESEGVRRLLTLTGLEERMDFAPSQAGALEEAPEEPGPLLPAA